MSTSMYELERKWLLKDLPDLKDFSPTPFCVVQQGWFGGIDYPVRVRWDNRHNRDNYHMGVKGGHGLKRVELEERIGKELFSKLWPLTQGRRVIKMRFFVNWQDVLWEIDKFLDRDLYLAEVEFKTEDPEKTHVDLPFFLKDVVDREVTGEPGYEGIHLGA